MFGACKPTLFFMTKGRGGGGGGGIWRYERKLVWGSKLLSGILRNAHASAKRVKALHSFFL